MRFSISYRYSATMTEIIEADDEFAAMKIAESIAYDDNWEPEPDNIDDVDISVHRMYHVQRQDGKTMWTTYVRDTYKRLEE